jgi:acyl-CoA dehydrogenase
MTLHAAWRLDRHRTEDLRLVRQEISMIKFFGARVLHDVIDRALQVNGALGFSGDLPLEEMYRNARAARIYDGPDEVHRMTVARQVLKGYQTPPGHLPSEHIPTRREAAQRKFAELLEQAT